MRTQFWLATVLVAGLLVPASPARGSDEFSGIYFDALRFMGNHIDVAYYVSADNGIGLRTRLEYSGYSLSTEYVTQFQAVLGVNWYFMPDSLFSPYLYAENAWWSGEIEGETYSFHESMDDQVARAGLGLVWARDRMMVAVELGLGLTPDREVTLPAASSRGDYTFMYGYFGVKVGVQLR